MADKKAVLKNEDENADKCGGSLFSKKQLVRSERFSDRRDIIDALLSDKEKYTADAVEKIIEKFMKGQVR